MSEIEIQTAETSETLEKRDKNWKELRAKFEEYKEKAKDGDEWKINYDELQIAFKEKEIRQPKELYMAKVDRMSPEALATINSGGSKDSQSRMTAQELRVSRELVAPPQVSQSALNSRNTIPDPSNTYMAPRLQKLFEKVARAAMNEINSSSG